MTSPQAPDPNMVLLALSYRHEMEGTTRQTVTDAQGTRINLSKRNPYDYASTLLGPAALQGYDKQAVAQIFAQVDQHPDQARVWLSQQVKDGQFVPTIPAARIAQDKPELAGNHLNRKMNFGETPPMPSAMVAEQQALQRGLGLKKLPSQITQENPAIAAEMLKVMEKVDGQTYSGSGFSHTVAHAQHEDHLKYPDRKNPIPYALHDTNGHPTAAQGMRGLPTNHSARQAGRAGTVVTGFTALATLLVTAGGAQAATPSPTITSQPTGGQATPSLTERARLLRSNHTP